jgi:hypothetical protein
MADNYKWTGATSGEWNVAGNWDKWNGSAWVTSTTIPCRDSGPSDDNILFTGTVSNGMTSRDSTYIPNCFGTIEVAADYSSTDWLPNQSQSDVPLDCGGPVIVRKDGMTILQQAGVFTNVYFYSESEWVLYADYYAVEGTVYVIGDGCASFAPGAYAYCLMGSGASCCVSAHAENDCSASTDPPDESDVKVGVDFENSLKTGTLVVEGTRLAQIDS